MSLDTSFGKVRFFEDFLGDAGNADNYTATTDGGGAAAINEQSNGVFRLSVDTDDNDISNLFFVNIWKCTQQNLVMEWRIKTVTSVADGETFVGVTDDDGTDENPITLSTTDVATTNTSNGAGFCYTGAGTANWKFVTVKADADGAITACNKGGISTPVVGTFQTFKVVFNEDGDADAYINGIWQVTNTSAVTTTTLLAAGLACQSGGTARSVDADYVYIEAGRI